MINLLKKLLKIKRNIIIINIGKKYQKKGDYGMSELERLMIESKPTYCSHCGERVFYASSGKFHCKSCGKMSFDVYGKVHDFVERNGMNSIIYMSQNMGIEPELIEMILEKGDVTIPKDSKYYLECIHCGCSIHDGKYCPFCKRDIAGGIRGLMYEDMQRKKGYLNPDLTGSMHIRRR